MVWRPVLAGKASYYEVTQQWTLEDLMQCAEIMDIQQALEEDAMKKNNNKN